MSRAINNFFVWNSRFSPSSAHGIEVATSIWPIYHGIFTEYETFSADSWIIQHETGHHVLTPPAMLAYLLEKKTHFVKDVNSDSDSTSSYLHRTYEPSTRTRQRTRADTTTLGITTTPTTSLTDIKSRSWPTDSFHDINVAIPSPRPRYYVSARAAAKWQQNYQCSGPNGQLYGMTQLIGETQIENHLHAPDVE